MKKFAWLLVFILCISLIPAFIAVINTSPASSISLSTWYVATTGSDAAAGDISHPFRTIQHAVDVAQAGHTIYVRGGTYYEQIWMKRCGTAGNPITIAGYHGETAIIDGTSISVGDDALVNLGVYNGDQQSYLTFNNLVIQNSAHVGLATSWGNYPNPSHDITISYCTFKNIKYNAIYIWQDDPGMMGYPKISNVILSHCIFDNIQWGMSLGECITLRGVTNCLIEYNTLTRCYKIGINPSDADYTIVDHNTIECSYMKQTSDGAQPIGIYNDGGQREGCRSSYVTISNNYVYGSGETMGLIGYCNEKGATIYMDHLTIENNVLYAAGSGQVGIVSFVNRGYPANYYSDIVIKHNTIYTPNGRCISSSIGAGYVSNSVIANNIFYGGEQMTLHSCSGYTVVNNIFYPGNSVSCWGTGGITQNPLFVNAGSDFHLQSGSPAINSASATYGVSSDFDGYLRDSQPDIGAYEYYTTSLPPDAPNIDGPASGKVGVSYSYNFVAFDPNGDDVYYRIDWSDGTPITDWIGPYYSGQVVIVTHIFTNTGLITIRCQAKDTYNSVSNWGQLEVIMPKGGRTFIPSPLLELMERLFERSPNAFPTLRQLLGY